LFLLAEFLGDDEVRPVDECAPQRRASVGECGRIERAASAIRPHAAGLIDRDAVAGGEVDTVDVCAVALIVEKNFLHHATEAAAAVRQFPSEVGQRLTIVLVVSKDDCGGLNFRFGAHDNVRCSNHVMVSRERLDDREFGGQGRNGRTRSFPSSPLRTDGFTVYVANLRSYGKTERIAANPLLHNYLGSIDNPELMIYKVVPNRVSYMQEWALEYHNVPLP